MTSRDEQRDERRKRILEIALDEFNQHGFHGASTRRITKAAGVSSGLLFHYFPSKLAVYEELVRIAFRYISMVFADATDNPLAYFERQAAFVISLLSKKPQSASMFTFMAYAEQHPGISEIVDELFEERDLVELAIPVIKAGQQAGSIRAGDPEALAVAFWSALQGLAVDVAVRSDRALPDPNWIVDILRKDRDA